MSAEKHLLRMFAPKASKGKRTMTDQHPAAFDERIESKIFLVRGQQVMLGMHLAEMYEVEPQALDRAVETHIESFPEGSVLRLTPEEITGLEAQVAISDRAAPYAFTGAGMAMLASILLDEHAVSGDEACAPTCSCRL